LEFLQKLASCRLLQKAHSDFFFFLDRADQFALWLHTGHSFKTLPPTPAQLVDAGVAHQSRDIWCN